MEFTVPSPSRLDAFLASAMADTSRVRVQKMIADGAVRVNGKAVRKVAQPVRAGDRIAIADSPRPAPPALMTSYGRDDAWVRILYEDRSCLVIFKPAGTVVTDLEAPNRLLAHRLDKDTTGCLLLARDAQALAFLQRQFRERTISKTYLALVAGIPDPPKALIDAPIGRNLVNRTRMSVLATRVSRTSQTAYRTMAAAADCALLACDLLTGRTHQVRVHLSAIGHPVLGDPTYGTAESGRVSDKYGIGGICLHAWELAFVSPQSRENVAVRADPLPAFRSALAACHMEIPA